MKLLLFTFIVLCASISYAQEETKNDSFLSRNKPIELFSSTNSSDLQSIQSNGFKLKLPTEATLAEVYQSDFMSFMSNDNRMLNYPSGDLSDANDVTFGTYMNTSFNLGSSAVQTFYLFDHTGRLVDSTTSFSFGKKKK